MTLATSLALAAAIRFCSSVLISASSLPFGGSARDTLQIVRANTAAAKQYLSPRITNPPLQSQTYTPQSVFVSRKRGEVGHCLKSGRSRFDVLFHDAFLTSAKYGSLDLRAARVRMGRHSCPPPLTSGVARAPRPRSFVSENP